MILSASRRTDIPCYYSEWFMNRIRAGYVLTRNPMNHAQLSRIAITPDVVDCIVFWTKDSGNIISCLPELDRMGYNYYFQFTLTPYDRTIEPNLRNKTKIEEAFIELSKHIGKERVKWRYDPIIINASLDIAYHKLHFLRMCEKLSPYTNTVTISFVDMYPKLRTKLILPITEDKITELSAFIGKTAKEYGIRAVACCEKNDLTPFGIQKASCIDRELIERILSERAKPEKIALDTLFPDRNQREGCGCCESIDIGAYNTCMNGCIYCYANNDPVSTARRHKAHDPNGELLFGAVGENEKITIRKVKRDARILSYNK
ncbi:MAG: DUF1848 domain-containing protein [Oscillospiraceae bacterium]|nr:DUF1848 domain-containing protein [Oscillospiraceae bacterium]